MNHIHYGLGHPACHRKVTAVHGSVIDAFRIFFYLLHVHMPGVKDAVHFFKGKDEIHIASYVRTHGLQLLGCAGTDEYNLCIGMVPLNQPCRQGHGGQCHGNTVRMLREQLLSHHGPGRAAGCSHKGKLFRHFLDKVNCLLGSAQVGSHRHLKNVRKPQRLHGCTQLAGRHLWSELPHKSRGNCRINPFP